MLTQRGIDFTQEERLEGGMDLVRDGLGAWMEEMGGAWSWDGFRAEGE
jgi:hypothetical protein